MTSQCLLHVLPMIRLANGIKASSAQANMLSHRLISNLGISHHRSYLLRGVGVGVADNKSVVQMSASI